MPMYVLKHNWFNKKSYYKLHTRGKKNCVETSQSCKAR